MKVFHRSILKRSFFSARKPNLTKYRDGPNMINFEREIRDAAFDSDVPPMKVMSGENEQERDVFVHSRRPLKNWIKSISLLASFEIKN